VVGAERLCDGARVPRFVVGRLVEADVEGADRSVPRADCERGDGARLAAGDRVVVDGALRLAPDAPVKAKAYVEKIEPAPATLPAPKQQGT